MNNHRKRANMARASNGRSLLPGGPMYTEDAAKRIRKQCKNMFKIGNSSASRANPRNDCHDLEEDDEFLEDLSVPDHDVVDDVGLWNPQERHNPVDPVDASVAAFPDINQERHPTVAGILEGNENQISESEEEDEALTVSHDFDEIESPRVRVIPRERFISWALRNRKWSDLGVLFSTKQTIMKCVLNNLDAPYDTWITIFRNVIKYSGLSTVKYLCCRNHMLFKDSVISATRRMDSIRPECAVCLRLKTTPSYCLFEYIPLLPRLRAWLANERSFEKLFRYRWECCVNGDMSQEGNEGQTLYDYWNGKLYQHIIQSNGGESACAYDIFIAPSCDGFDVYRNRSYSCCPIVALNLSLDPSIRFLMKNVIPFGFVGGSGQPADLESFLYPMVNELHRINSSGGTRIRLHDGFDRTVRVHVCHFAADLQGLPKISGHCGPSGKKSCLCCDVNPFYLRSSRRYYLPSMIRQRTESGSCSSTQVRMVRLYDPERTRPRNVQETKRILRNLEPDFELDESTKQVLRKETGVTGKTILHSLPSFVPFYSFPIDTMHLGYNISKDFLQIFKGENMHLCRLPGHMDEDTVISEDDWTSIDAELIALGSNTAYCAFGSKPRPTSEYGSWKASEYRQFVLSYWLILLDGYLPRRIMRGLRIFTSVVELWSRPSLSSADVDNIGRLAVDFFRHFEKKYYRYEQSRVGLCKLTMHMLLHLKENMQNCGPLVHCNQFWVERYIEFTKSRLNARARAGESMTQNALLFEAYKLFYNEHFSDDMANADPAVDMNVDFSNSRDTEGIAMQSPCRLQKLSDARYEKLRLRKLLTSYISQSEGLSEEEADDAVQDDTFVTFGGAKMLCGLSLQTFGALLSGRKISSSSRANYYIASEYELDNDDASSESSAAERRTVYYGRILLFLEYTFKLARGDVTRQLFAGHWVGNLKVTELGQVYHDHRGEKMFTEATISDIFPITNHIGILEHHYPAPVNFSPRGGRKTFILDMLREPNYLLDATRLSPDGVNRTLGGLARNARSR